MICQLFFPTFAHSRYWSNQEKNSMLMKRKRNPFTKESTLNTSFVFQKRPDETIKKNGCYCHDW